jgi:hypothetical protein
MLTVQHLAAFSDGDQGGNPAGVVITDQLPEAPQMQRIAAEVGYSETVFAAPQGHGWRVRYFSPATEVPFCGHATVALGAALFAMKGADVEEVCNHSYGTLALIEDAATGAETYANTIVIPKNTPIPCEQSQTYVTSEDNENLRFLAANVAPATITVIAHEDERGDQRREQGVIRSRTGGSESWASSEHKHHSKRHQFLTNLALPSAQSFERLLHSILRPALRSGATENLGNNGRNGFELHVC